MRLTSVAPARHARLLLRAAAAAALAFGYLDLARGGMTLAPLLLTLAYLVLIPLVIMRRR